MKSRKLKWLSYIATVLGGATVFQSIGFTTTNGLDFSCDRFVSNGVLSATNFCFLLDCENGFLGGLIDPCNDPSQGATLLDCGTAPTGNNTDNSGGNTGGTGTTQRTGGFLGGTGNES